MRIGAGLLVLAAILAAPIAEAHPGGMCWRPPQARTVEEAVIVAQNEANVAAGRGMSGTPAMLALSDGRLKTAYSAGLIVGWGETGKRPAFSVVTAVGMSALLAPFAFIGRDGDGAIADIFACDAASLEEMAARHRLSRRRRHGADRSPPRSRRTASRRAARIGGAARDCLGSRRHRSQRPGRRRRADRHNPARIRRPHDVRRPAEGAGQGRRCGNAQPRATPHRRGRGVSVDAEPQDARGADVSHSQRRIVRRRGRSLRGGGRQQAWRRAQTRGYCQLTTCSSPRINGACRCSSPRRGRT